MEQLKKNKIIIILVFTFFNLFAQKKEDNFFSLFKDVTTPYLFDKLEYENIISKNSKEISFSDFEKNTTFLDNPNQKALKIEDTLNVKLYPICKYILNDYYCLSILIYSNNNNNVYSVVKMLFYNFENKLLNTNTVFLPIDVEGFEKTTILYHEKTIFINKSNGSFYTSNTKYPQFNQDIHEKDSIMNIKKIQYDDIPERRYNNKIIFNKQFYESANFINTIFIEKHISSNILVGVGGKRPINRTSYFINSYELANDKKIVFFKTDYEFEDYKTYSIIGYHILEEKNKLNKNEMISEYKITKDGLEIIYEGSIEIINNKLVVNRFDGYDKVTQEFLLKD